MFRALNQRLVSRPIETISGVGQLNSIVVTIDNRNNFFDLGGYEDDKYCKV